MHSLLVPFGPETDADPDRDLIMPLDRLRQFEPDRLAAAIRGSRPKYGLISNEDGRGGIAAPAGREVVAL
ncbi:hypothetical protein GCM10029992_18140 [Glycomyces albus]